jgi:hypothetical protein
MTNNKIDAIDVKYGSTIDVPKDNFVPYIMNCNTLFKVDLVVINSSTLMS